MPNVYADQVEWMHRHLARREQIVLSVHPHNDRGTAVAAAELAMLAGADRVEGCLFGNGERTGNVDVVTLASTCPPRASIRASIFGHQRRWPGSEECTQLPVHPPPLRGRSRVHGLLGFHQDAIKKGFERQRRMPPWAVPYMPVDRPTSAAATIGDPREQPVGQGRRRALAPGPLRPRDAAADAGGVQRRGAAPHRPQRPGGGCPPVVDALRRGIFRGRRAGALRATTSSRPAAGRASASRRRWAASQWYSTGEAMARRGCGGGLGADPVQGFEERSMGEGPTRRRWPSSRWRWTGWPAAASVPACTATR